jgi:hypothetical protein
MPSNPKRGNLSLKIDQNLPFGISEFKMLRQHTLEPKPFWAWNPNPNHLWDLIDWLTRTLSQATWMFKKLLHWPLGKKGWYKKVWEINLKHVIQLEWDFKFQSSKTENPQLALEKRLSSTFVITPKKKANRLGSDRMRHATKVYKTLNLRARKKNQNPKKLKNIHHCKVIEILWNQTSSSSRVEPGSEIRAGRRVRFKYGYLKRDQGQSKVCIIKTETTDSYPDFWGTAQHWF